MKTISNLVLCSIVAVIAKQVTLEYLLVKINEGKENGRFSIFYILIKWDNLRIIDTKFYCFSSLLQSTTKSFPR